MNFLGIKLKADYRIQIGDTDENVAYKLERDMRLKLSDRN